MLLMCKNTPVYDIDNEKILNTNLLPGLMKQKGANNHTFTKWMKYRYSSGTNTMARKLKGITFSAEKADETDAVRFCMPYKDEIKRMAGVAVEAENDVFRKRAQSILRLMR